jgi:WhiB family redox-sensing transcriptional regulator
LRNRYPSYDIADRLANEWKNDGACKGSPPGMFHPHDEAPGVRSRAQMLALRTQVEACKVVCRGCPVRDRCLQYALENGEVGIWGGTDDRERTLMRRRGRVA